MIRGVQSDISGDSYSQLASKSASALTRICTDVALLLDIARQSRVSVPLLALGSAPASTRICTMVLLCPSFTAMKRGVKFVSRHVESRSINPPSAIILTLVALDRYTAVHNAALSDAKSPSVGTEVSVATGVYVGSGV